MYLSYLFKLSFLSYFFEYSLLTISLNICLNGIPKVISRSNLSKHSFQPGRPGRPGQPGRLGPPDRP